jgi:hypothetical protein
MSRVRHHRQICNALVVNIANINAEIVTLDELVRQLPALDGSTTPHADQPPAPGAAAPPPRGRRFDALAVWQALDPRRQQTIGIAALLLTLATKAGVTCTPPADEWELAEEAAWEILDAATPALDYPSGPELEALGLPGCRVCVDLGGVRTEGCAWIDPELCAACRDHRGCNADQAVRL